jgi:putative membrane protein
LLKEDGKFIEKNKMSETEKINKDLILREKLAIQRTDMAIDRTILSFVRTSLYFIIAGMTINTLIDISYGSLAEIIFCVAGILILVIGVIKFIRQKKKLKEAKNHIGNYTLEWEDD